MNRHTAITGSARPMLIWITSPQHERALAEDLAADFLVVDRVGVVGQKGRALGRREQPVGELVALDVEADGFLGFGFEIDRLLAAAAEVGRMQQAAADVGPQQRADRRAARSARRCVMTTSRSVALLLQRAATPARPPAPAAGSAGTTPPATRWCA